MEKIIKKETRCFPIAARVKKPLRKKYRLFLTISLFLAAIASFTSGNLLIAVTTAQVFLLSLFFISS